MIDSEAARLAKYMTDDPAVVATLPTFRDLGPISTMYSEDMLLLLSLVSEDCNRKVHQRLVQERLGKELTQNERERWNKLRSELRAQLIKAGKIQEQ